MSVISHLSVLLTAGVGGYVAGMKQAKSATTDLRSAISPLTAGIGALLGAAGIGLSVSMLKDFASAAMQAGDSLNDMAGITGVAASELSRLHYIAELNGSSAEDVDKGFQKLNQNLGDVARGDGKAAAEALAVLGLSLDTLMGMNPADRFREIAEALSQVTDPAERASLVVDLFGKAGQNLTNVLALGKAGLAQWAAEADRLGITLTEIDVTKLGEAQDAADRLGFVLEGVRNRVTAELAPALTFLANVTAEWIASMTSSGAIVDALEFIVVGIGHIIDFIDVLRIAWNGARLNMMASIVAIIRVLQLMAKGIEYVGNLVDSEFGNDMSQTLGNAANAIEQEMSATVDTIGELASRDVSGTIGKQFNELRIQANAAAAAAQNTNKAVTGLGDSSGHTADAVQKIIDRLEDQALALKSGADVAQLYELQQAGATADELAHAQSLMDQVAALKERDEMMKAAARTIEENRTPIEKFVDRLAELDAQLAAGAIDWQTYERAVTAAKDQLDRQGAAGVDTAPRMADFSDTRQLTGVIEAGKEAAGVDGMKAIAEKQAKLAEEANKISAQAKAVLDKIEAKLNVTDGEFDS